MKFLPGTKKGLEETKDFNGCGVEMYLSQQVKTLTGQQRILLDGHVPRGLDYMTVHYSIYPVSGKYPALVEYLKRYPDCAKCAQLGRHLLARVRSRVKHQIS